MIFNPKFFYNGYRSVLEGQLRYCTKKWVNHVNNVLKQQEEEKKKNDLQKNKKTR